jgi:hypothetical protein
MTVIELVLSAVAIVVAAALFTNAVEILGERLNLGQGAVGSVLAAVGTALPETMIPIVAVLASLLTGSGAAGDIGVGAILGAPFLLATLGMFVAGISALGFRRRRESDDDVMIAERTTRQDMIAFLVFFALGAGAGIVPVPVDWEGLDVAAGIKRAANARAVCVTPSHQFPLGVTMTLARRLALLEWAKSSGAWIFEDDYDSEYRYGGRPHAALHGLDRAGRVIYIGTFSKVLFPSLRLGYLVVPPDAADAFASARAVVDRFSPLHDQAVLADFINEGHFGRHVRRMRSLYAERQNILLKALSRELGELVEARPSDAGLHLVAWLPKYVNDRALARSAAERGVLVQPLSLFCLEARRPAGILLGFGGMKERQLRLAAQRLASALRHQPRSSN